MDTPEGGIVINASVNGARIMNARSSIRRSTVAGGGLPGRTGAEAYT